MKAGLVDDLDGYELTWHEDDELHQAEGAISAHLGISVDRAARVLQERADTSGRSRAEVAEEITRRLRGVNG
jgi:hypothetical protein